MAREENNSGRNAEQRHPVHGEMRATAAHQPRPQVMSRSMLTTGALIGAAALIAPELLMGMVVGAGIVMASDWLPDLVSTTVRPLVKSAIKAGYTAATMAREMASEASETIQDMVAEARAENGPPQ